MDFLKQVYRILISPRFTISIFAVLTIIISGAALLDMELIQETKPVISSGVVYSHQFFIVLSFLLLLVTLLCTIRQFRRNYLSWRRDMGSRVNKLRFVGSPLFHLGLCIVILGAIIDVYGGMTASKYLRPGESFLDLPDRYTFIEVKPLYLGGFNDFGLTVKEIKETYYPDGVGTQAIIDLVTEEQHQEIALDRNTKHSVGLKTLSRSSYGYYMAYQIQTTDGRSLPYTLGLVTERINQMDQYYREGFRQPATPFTLDVEYLPNADLSKQPYKLKSYEPKNPVLLATISNGAEELFKGPIPAGQSVSLKDGTTFSFDGAIPYILLEVNSVLGTYVVTIGFLMFLTGLILYYIFRVTIFTPIRGEGGDGDANH